MRVAKGEQLPLPLRDSAADLRLPLPIAWRKVKRAIRRRLAAVDRNRLSMSVVSSLEAQALMEQVLRSARCRARGAQRKSKARTAQYFATPEGRRAARAIAALAERSQEARLCG